MPPQPHQRPFIYIGGVSGYRDGHWRQETIHATDIGSKVYKETYLPNRGGAWRSRESREHKPAQAREQAHYKQFKLARKLMGRGK